MWRPLWDRGVRTGDSWRCCCPEVVFRGGVEGRKEDIVVNGNEGRRDGSFDVDVVVFVFDLRFKEGEGGIGGKANDFCNEDAPYTY